MKKIQWILTFVLVVLFGSNAGAQESYPLETILDNMERVGRDFRSLEAKLDEDNVNVLVDIHTLSHGRVYLARKDDESMLRMKMDDPAPQDTLVARGKAQVYQERINQVQEFDLGENRNIAEYVLIGFGASKASMLEHYDITLAEPEIIDGVAMSVIDLVPKSERVAAMYATIRLWLDQGRWIPIRSRTAEPGGNYTIRTLSDFTINGSIPDSTFELDLPKDVTVIKG